MKTSVVVSATLTAFFIMILVAGSILNPETHISNSITIEAPEAVVWNVIASPDEYENWYKSIRQTGVSQTNIQNKFTRDVNYLINGRELAITERIDIYESSERITFTQIDTTKKSLIHNIRQSMVLNTLPDGSTEAVWECNYSTPPVLSKLLEMVVIRPALNELMSSNLASLKKYIER